MKFLTQYAINFGRLIEGKHEFQFQLKKKFFEHFDYD